MSFAKEQKTEILLVTDKSACCRRATLFGVLSSKASIDDDFLYLTLDGDATVSYIAALVQEFYSKTPEIVRKECGGRGKTIRFDSKSAIKYVLNLRNNEIFNPKCSSCTAAFLRGVYLASGRLADPTKQHHFELSVLSNRIEAFREYFATLGLNLSLANRQGAQVLYSRRSDTIEDFFALAGMNQAVFALMNAKIQGDMRNTANRIANCETNNIDKAVSASMEQIVLLEELSKRGLLSQLPEDLEYTARMRMEHKDLSLSRLAAIITPPISKPGLSHRLKKITEYAKNLIGDVTK